MSAVSRRKFLADGVAELCGFCGAAVLGAGALKLAFGAEPGGDICVVLFLRGACDGLNIVPPVDGPDRALYEAARPNLKVPVSGDGAALRLDGRLGLHPAAKPLHELYLAGKLAIVHGCGLTADTRSHFDAQALMELGTPDNKNTTSGWITRHLLSLNSRPSAPSFLTAVSLGTLTPNSLLAYPEVAVINSLDGFNIAGPKNFQNDQRETLRRMCEDGGWVEKYGRETLDAIDAFEMASPSAYKPAGRDYPKADIGNRFRTLAQIIKMDLGLTVATIDMGGWDTHKYQGDGSTGYFANLLGQLSQALAAFHEDMEAGTPRKVTVVVMSEFGRRLKENASRGTDHGHGNVMFVLGQHVAGGKIYGKWPGLENENLYQRADLAVTTDYRRVLSEILAKRLSNKNAAKVFPGFTNDEPLNLIEAG
jgi:uncharacterized protein (DUF1501 family)